MQIVKGFGKKSLKKLKKFFTLKLPLKSLKPLILLGQNALRASQTAFSSIFSHPTRLPSLAPSTPRARGARRVFAPKGGTTKTVAAANR
jgi:hypothetical protein